MYRIRNFFKKIFSKRTYRFFWQRITRGWDDSETWSLDYNIIEYLVPRLERFRELHIDNPCDITFDEWNNILDEIIWSFKYIYCVKDYGGKFEKKWIKDIEFDYDNMIYNKIDRDIKWERVLNGRKLFIQYFDDLWW
jgi:hypothetical protein